MKEIIIDEVTYLVGNNCKENDQLFGSTPSDSVWFHLEEDPSAHVYALKNGDLTREELKYAANLVRKYSKGQGKVIYLEKKYLKLIGNGLIEMTKTPKII